MRTVRMTWLCLLIVCPGSLVAAEAVIGWRGDGRGNFPDAHPPTKFSASENLAWKAEIGQGCGAAIIVGKRLFVQAAPNALVCLDKATGKELWRRERHAGNLDPQSPAAQLDAAMEEIGAFCRLAQKSRKTDKGTPEYAALETQVKQTGERLSGRLAQVPGAKTNGGGIHLICMTPCSDGRSVVAVFPTGIAVAYDVEGKLLWSASVRPPAAPPKEHGQGKWKTVPPNLSTCPVFTEEGILVVVWGPVTAGIEAASGKILWRAYGGISHCSPVVGRIGGASYVARGDDDILRVRDGLKVHDDPRPVSHNCSVSPVFADGVFHWVTHAVKVAAGDPPRSQVLWAWNVETLREVARGGSGFPYDGAVAFLRNVDFTSPVVVGGKLVYYGWHRVNVFDPTTGNVLGQYADGKVTVKPLSGGVTKNWAYGGMVHAGDRLILVHDNGLVKIFPINGTFAPMQACAIPDDVYAQPACDGSALYIRSVNALWRFDNPAATAPKASDGK